MRAYQQRRTHLTRQPQRVHTVLRTSGQRA
jgi:hypothetical protein